jgi:peptide/nickel transport system substrate-binding protein
VDHGQEHECWKPVQAKIGSGPFRFVESEYKPGARIVYEKNPDYMPRSEPASGFAGGKVVKVDRVEWVIIPDPSTAYNSIKQGEVDMLDAPPLDLLPTIAGDPHVVIGEVWPLESYAELRFNCLWPPFNNVKKRSKKSPRKWNRKMVGSASWMRTTTSRSPLSRIAGSRT